MAGESPGSGILLVVGQSRSGKRAVTRLQPPLAGAGAGSHFCDWYVTIFLHLGDTPRPLDNDIPYIHHFNLSLKSQSDKAIT